MIGSRELRKKFEQAVLECLPQDIKDKVLRGWVKDKEALSFALRKALVVNTEYIRNTYPVIVDYGQSVEKALKSGNFKEVGEDINSQNFKSRRFGRKMVEIEVISFDWYISSYDIQLEFNKVGYRPAELLELIAFASKYFNIHPYQGSPIVALGSSFSRKYSYPGSPYLIDEISFQKLDLEWNTFGWSQGYYFAVVRE